MLYQHPAYVAFGGKVVVIIPGLRITGQVDGQLAALDPRFNVKGSVEACFFGGLIEELGCGSVTAWVSDRGLAACVGDPTNPKSKGWHPGAGYKWGLNVPEIWFPDGCKPSHYWNNTIVAPSAHASAAGDLTFTVAKGEDSKSIKLTGAGGAPKVKITSPKGETISTDEGNFVHHGTLGVLRPKDGTEGSNFNTTWAGVLDGVPGTYTVTPLPNSPKITGLAETRPGERELKASVKKAGKRRVLSYEVGGLAGKKVTFFERGKASYRALGTAKSSKGKIKFTPTIGPGGKREIVARIEVDGMMTPERVVAHFKAPDRTTSRPSRQAESASQGAPP